MFLSFLDIYEYTIRFLEILCIGHAFDSIDLQERIKQLTHFVPRIEGVFVKKSGKEYYLVSELEKAKEVEKMEIKYSSMKVYMKVLWKQNYNFINWLQIVFRSLKNN